MSAQYPLVFTFQDAVSGNGFVAKVTVSGRALLAHEDGEWWMLGVRPAALAASGATPPDAHLAFRADFKAVLFDAAAEAKDYDAFRAEVERFFHERDLDEEARWQAAGAAITNGAAVEAPFDALPRESPDTRPVAISVQRLDLPAAAHTASDNVLDSYALTAAA